MSDTLPCQYFATDTAGTATECLLPARTAPQDCPKCERYAPLAADTERTACEVWSRVMGYHRPISAYNAGKQAEHRERRYFREHHLREGAGHD
jgi:anaerobic ribonucleoside-triphosphate reductase